MIAQAADHAVEFRHAIGDKGFVLIGIIGAGKHEVMPEQYAMLVTQIVKNILFIAAAAPYTEHIVVALYGALDEDTVFLIGHPGVDRVCGDPVGALAEYLDAIDGDGKGLALVPQIVLHHLYNRIPWRVRHVSSALSSRDTHRLKS